MIQLLDSLPVASILAVIVAVVGGVVAITNPDALSFSGYCQDVGIAAGGLGVLGVARAQSGKGAPKS